MYDQAEKLTDLLLKTIDSKKELNINRYEKYVKLNESEDTMIKLSVSKDSSCSPNLVDSYLDDINPNEIRFYKFFERNIPLTDSMNPHVRPYPLGEYFVSSISDKRLNHLVKLDDLLKDDISSYGNKDLKIINDSKERGGIVVIGEKGSGKTFSQNVWLHANNKILENNKIFWVRVDVSKIFDIWRETNIGNANMIKVEEYYLGQLLYVFSKHYNPEFPLFSPMFGEIANKLSRSEYNYIDYSYQKSKSELMHTVSDFDNFVLKAQRKKWFTILDCLKDLEHQIAVYEELNKGNTRLSVSERIHQHKSFLVDKVLIDSQNYPSERYRGSKNDWTVLGSLLKRFILDNGYYILLIIDGLDNLNFYDKDSEAYTRLIHNQLFRFPLRNESTHPNELLLLSLRNETYQSLLRFSNNRPYDDRNIYKDIEGFGKIIMDTNHIQNTIFEKRIKYVISKYYGPECMMKTILNEMVKNHYIQDENRWNSNIRCFLNNHLTLAKFITFRYYFANQPSNFNINDQIKIFEDINYLLNGQLYLDDEAKQPLTNKGYNFFNIFKNNISSEKSPSHLSFLRVLQIIKHEPNIESQKLYKIALIFSLDKEDVDYCLNRLIRTGMVLDSVSSYNGMKIKYTLTSKGKYFIRQFFTNIHYLYHACIDTPLPVTVSNGMSVHTNNPKLKKHGKTLYAPHCLKTGIMFLEFITQINNYQLNRIIRKRAISIDLSPYKIPTFESENYSTFRSSVQAMVNSCLSDEDSTVMMRQLFKI